MCNMICVEELNSEFSQLEMFLNTRFTQKQYITEVFLRLLSYVQIHTKVKEQYL